MHISMPGSVYQKLHFVFLEFAGISGGMNYISDDLTVRHLDTLESRYGCGAFGEAYVFDI